MTGKNVIRIQVRSTEIDVNGHVNNAKYLEYLEWGREDWYEETGLDYQTLTNIGISTVVAHVSANYRHEAVQNDTLTITTWLEEVRNTSLVMAQTIYNQRVELVLDASFVLVCVDPTTHTKVRVPDAIRNRLCEHPSSQE